MSQEIQLKQLKNQKLLSVDENISEITDYQDNPYIYNSFLEYILAIVGLTVGVGSFWRFPYITYKNGGGTFILVYAIVMIVVGIPMTYLEIGIGQMHRHSYPFILKRIHPALKMIGVAFLINAVHISTYYNLILTYSYRYVFSAFNWELPFAAEKITENHYFHDVVLHKTDSINDYGGFNVPLFFIYVVSLYICHSVVKHGAKTSGKIVVFTALSPFFFLIILMIRGFFLDGAYEGVVYLFTPKWHLFFSTTVWIDALVQVFYQLSIAIGCIVNMSAMKPKRQDFLKSAYIIPFSIIFCGILSALNIFMYMGHFCKELGMSIQQIKLAGVQLSYNLFPKALCLLPWPNLWVLIFFISMVLLGLDSLFGFIECIYFYIKDEMKQGPIQIWGIEITKQRAHYLALVYIGIGSPFFCSYAGIYYLQFVDFFITNIPFTFGALVEIYIFVYVFKFEQMRKQVKKWTGADTPSYIVYFLQSKLLVAILTINFALAFIRQIFIYNEYTIGFYLAGWAISLYPIVLYVMYFRKNWTCKEDLKLTFEQLKKQDDYL